MRSFQDICKRAGGRRRYNAQRKAAWRARHAEVERLLDLYRTQHGRYKRGLQARIARELGVSRTTIGRHMIGIRFMEWALENPVKACRFVWEENGEPRDVPDWIILGMFGRDRRPALGKRKVRCEARENEDWSELQDPLSEL